MNCVFSLYFVGGSPNSLQAIDNLTGFIEKNLREPYQIELIDIRQDPLRALDDGVFLSPTLVRSSPDPQVRVVGNLSDPLALRSLLYEDRPGF